MTYPCPECGKLATHVRRDVPECVEFVDELGVSWIAMEGRAWVVHNDGTECEI